MKSAKCPNCGVPVRLKPKSSGWPFCSERCRLIDFGGWINEEHHIVGEELPSDLNEGDLDELGADPPYRH